MPATKNGDVPDESGLRTTITGGVKRGTDGTSAARDFAAGSVDDGATWSGKAFHNAAGRVGDERARPAGATSAAETSAAKTRRTSRILHPLPSLTVRSIFLGARLGTCKG
jgi:hypothetical protein